MEWCHHQKDGWRRTEKHGKLERSPDTFSENEARQIKLLLFQLKLGRVGFLYKGSLPDGRFWLSPMEICSREREGLGGAVPVGSEGVSVEHMK